MQNYQNSLSVHRAIHLRWSFGNIYIYSPHCLYLPEDPGYQIIKQSASDPSPSPSYTRCLTPSPKNARLYDGGYNANQRATNDESAPAQFVHKHTITVQQVHRLAKVQLRFQRGMCFKGRVDLGTSLTHLNTHGTCLQIRDMEQFPKVKHTKQYCTQVQGLVSLYYVYTLYI